MGRSSPLVAVLLFAACTSSSAPGPPQPSLRSEVRPFFRGCGSAVFGHPNLRNAVSIGPLELVGARQAARLAPGAFRAHAGRYQAIKVLAVVRGTDDVTLTVPPSARAALALLYDPAVRANRSGFRFSAGDPRVTFEACGSTDANYNGGFLATRPICVSLQVSTASMRAEGRVSLGTGPSCQA